MNEPEVWTFFYGSFINLDVLKDVGYVPRAYEVTHLPGYDITIRPLANLVPSERHTAYGIVATATHSELARLYDHAENVLGGQYLPRAVLIQTESDRWMPALCYLAPNLSGAPAAPDYVDRMLKPAKAHGFPPWYVERIAAFKP